MLTGPLLSSVVTLAAASSVSQYRVGKPSRRVVYQHVVDDVARNMPSSFIFHEAQETPMDSSAIFGVKEQEAQDEPLEFLVDPTSDCQDVWSVVADATRWHPLGPHYRSRRHDNTQQQQQKKNAKKQGEKQLPKEDNVPRRQLQVSDKFVLDSTSAVIQDVILDESEAVDEGHGDENAYAPDEFLHENYVAYNVTAQVVYNVSEPEHNEKTVGYTASTVITSSFQLPNNSSSAPQSTSRYLPLRIRAILSGERDGGEHLTDLAREVLLKDIIQPALMTWSAALRVEPVVGNLTVDRSQLFDNQTCGPGLDSGLPSPKVPQYHMTEGIPETDLILYLSIGFSPGGWTTSMGDYLINSTLDDLAPLTSTASSVFPYLEWTNVPTGAPTLSLHAGATQHGANRTGDTRPLQPAVRKLMLCGGDYVAAASYCSTDQYDRPTAGMLHLCIDPDFFEMSQRNKTIVTIMHEVGHVLGFNSRSMAHFRRPDGTPVTPRVDGEIVETEVECTGPSTARRYANVTLPSEEILQFRSVRGGVRVAEMVTPSVLQVVRNHFDCQELSGAELESGEYSPLAGNPVEQACIGDHWERRLFRNDFMNPVVDGVEYSPFISTITLAYFADSGWYQIDLTMAELAGSWGRGAGCSFVEDTCIDGDGHVSPSFKPFFCDNAATKKTANGLLREIAGCTDDLSRKASCSLGAYEEELPLEYQYFGESLGGTVGGDDPFIDYCPTYAGFANGLCSNKENAAILQVNQIERFGSRNSRCLVGVVQASSTALCLPIACVAEDRTLHVKINGFWRQCESKEQKLKVFEDGFIVCPDPRRVCPTFYCHHDCLGTSGRCDYASGACVCNETSGASTGNKSVTGTLETLTGICRQGEHESLYAAASIRNVSLSLSVMPPERSPLSDYYFVNKTSLQDDRTELLTPWHTVLLTTAAVVVIVVALYWYFRLRHGVEREEDGGDGDSPGTAEVPNPDKHKMIAAVLVDMRIHAPTQGSGSIAPTAGTAASLSGLESTDSSQCLSFDGGASVANEELLEDGEALESKRKSSLRKIRQRRFRGHG
jgi:Leishmanolysin